MSMQAWKNYITHRPQQPKKKMKTIAGIKVSEVHSSCQALKYVFNIHEIW